MAVDTGPVGIQPEGVAMEGGMAVAAVVSDKNFRIFSSCYPNFLTPHAF